MDGELTETLNSWRQVVVNGEAYENNDAMPSGRDILNLASLTPASEHQLIMVRKNRTRLVGPDDKVDLKVEKGAVFRAFAGDRVYSWTLDEIGQVWGAEALEVDELLGLFTINPDKELVLERDDHPDIVLRPGGSVSLVERGTEDIVTRRKQPEFVLVSVFTTAGVFPAQGAVRVKADTLVSEVLERAAKKLDLGDTANWVVTIDGRDIDPAATFAQNGLTGTVELDWSPREGGGGDACETLAKGAFERDVGRLDKRLVEQRGWTVVKAEYPVLDVIFGHPSRAPLRLRFTCDDWDDLPPSIELLTADGGPIPPQGSSHPHDYVFANGSGVFNPSGHPITGRPFICMRGSREFHTHSSHLGEVWDNYRGKSGNDLVGLLDQLWRVWKRAAQ